MPEIPARIILDSLPASQSPELAQLMADVRALLDRIQEQQREDGRVLWSRDDTAARMGISVRTLDGLDIPRVMVGCRPMFRPAAVRQWCAEHERVMEAV